MKEKSATLEEIYGAFDRETRQYRTAEACGKGCGFCCSHAGSIDITTLEGLAILDVVNGFPVARQKDLARALRQEVRKREKGEIAPCPFLSKARTCTIYSVRPFSCRRIYSLHVCTLESPPQLSRTVMDMAGQSIRALQLLDNTGYSGHISYILNLLETPAFKNTYLSGDFKPRDIMAYGKSHRIFINRIA